jgi:hypothetical protein
MSDRLLPPYFTELSCTRASLFRGSLVVDTWPHEADTRKTDRPHGDRAVHAADSRSVLRLGAIYDPLRHVRLVSTGLFTLVARLRDEPLTSLSCREPRSPPSQVGRFELAVPKTASFAPSVKTTRKEAIRDAFHRSSFEASPPAVPLPLSRSESGCSDDRDRPLATPSEGCRRSTLSNVDRSSRLCHRSVDREPPVRSAHPDCTCMQP